MPRNKPTGPCSVEGCDRAAETKGMCGKHYRMHRLYGRTEKVRGLGKAAHPLYSIWFERRSRGSLCPEWHDDFWAMVRTVGDRPSARHFLVQPTRFKPYGPDNWEWRRFLRREAGETEEAFNARKWKNRRRTHPNAERRRHLVRTFGITTVAYEEMLADQGGVCAICQKAETATTSGGKVRSLAVDHHHASGRVRDLLCFRCNSIIGKIEESPEFVLAVLRYIEKWSNPLTAPARPTTAKPQDWRIILQTPDGPLSVSEAARRAGLRPATVISRIRLGWPESELLTPLKRPRRRQVDPTE